MLKKSLYLLLLLTTFSSFGQEERERIPRIDFHYQFQIPGGDMKERFGSNSNIGGSFHLKNKHNVFYEFSGGFIFSKNVNDLSLVDGISTPEGVIFDVDGRSATLALFERGFHLGLGVGYVSSLLAKNEHSGIYAKIGTIFLQHKIRLEHQNHDIPSLDKDYSKGYDKLSNGMGLEEEIGYYYTDPKNLLNFRIALNYVHTTTAGRRSYNFDEKQADNSSRKDNLLGFKVSFAIPLTGRKADNYYLY